MKIETAIGILANLGKGVSPYTYAETLEAVKLGIEALKRVSEERTGYENYAPDLLLGETT